MSHKPVSTKFKDVSRPPEGKPWVWHTLDLKASPAWKSRSIWCVKLLEFLELEHGLHAGQENGQLQAPYPQLIEWGIPRNKIPAAIAEAEALRLIEVSRGGKKNQVENHANRYRLTYYPMQIRGAVPPYWVEPDNIWKHVTQGMADTIVHEMDIKRRTAKRGNPKNKSQVPHAGTTSVPHAGTEGQDSQGPASVPHGGTPYYILAPAAPAAAAAAARLPAVTDAPAAPVLSVTSRASKPAATNKQQRRAKR